MDDYYGPKLFWIIPKCRIIVGLAPTNSRDYEAARKVADDFRAIKIQIIFLNETDLTFNSPELKVLIEILALIFSSVAMLSYLLVQSQ